MHTELAVPTLPQAAGSPRRRDTRPFDDEGISSTSAPAPSISPPS